MNWVRAAPKINGFAVRTVAAPPAGARGCVLVWRKIVGNLLLASRRLPPNCGDSDSEAGGLWSSSHNFATCPAPPTNPAPWLRLSHDGEKTTLGPRMVSGSSLLTATLVVGDRRRHCCERRAAAATPPFDVGGFALCVCVCGGLPPAGFYLEPQLPPWYHTTTNKTTRSTQ